MPVGGVMPERLRAVLDRCACLIVLCTPASARSFWVGEEIRYFAGRHPDRAILPVIGAGSPDDGDCFHEALTLAGPPLAADVRERVAFRSNVARIAAAVLGVDVDDLVRRVQRREVARVSLTSGAIGAAVASVAAMGVVTYQQAERAREADDLARANIERLLGDTRKAMDQVGQLAAKQVLHNAAEPYFSGKPDTRMSDADWLLKAEWLRQQAVDTYSRGEIETSRAQRQAAHAITRRLLAAAHKDPARLFSHAQSAYYFGEIHWLTHDADGARSGYQEYLDIALRLVEAAPGDPAGRLEAAYAATNLAVLQREADHDPRGAADTALRAIRAILPLATDAGVRLELARVYRHRIYALSHFQTAADIADEMEGWGALLLQIEREDAPANPAAFTLANAWSLIERLSLWSGRSMEARQAAARLAGIVAAGLNRDPDNEVWREFAREISAANSFDCGPGVASTPQVARNTYVRWLRTCLAKASVDVQRSACRAVLAELESPVPFRLERNAAEALAACLAFAERAGAPDATAGSKEAIERLFGARSPDSLALDTQIALARLPQAALPDRLSTLPGRLTGLGWRNTGD